MIGLVDQAVQEGATYEDLAKVFELDTAYSLKTGWRYHYDRMPHIHTAKLIAKHFGLPLSEVYPITTGEDNEEEASDVVMAKELLAAAMGSDRVAMLTDRQILSIIKGAVVAAEGMLPES